MNTVAELIQWLLTMPQDAVPVINMGLNELANAKPAVKVEPVLAYHQHGIWHEVAFPHLPPDEDEVRQLVVNISSL